MHDEQKSLNKAKTYKAIKIDNIPNEILSPQPPHNHNISTESLGSGLYAAY